MIKLTNVNKKYGDLLALSNFNFEFKTKKIYGIRGKSGSGKSTLTNMIGGLTNPTSGEIQYDRSIKNLHTDISYIFQESYLYENLTLEENIKIVLKINQCKNENIVNKVLDQLEILQYKNKRIDQLSVGEKQRASIAVAILKDSKVLIADEPTSALDIENAKNIFAILKELSKEILVIVISHNDDLIREYCDEILYLDAGQLNDTKSDAQVIETSNSYFSIQSKGHNLSLINSFYIYHKVIKNQITRQIFTGIFVMLFVATLSVVINLINIDKNKIIGKAIDSSEYLDFIGEDDRISTDKQFYAAPDFNIKYRECIEMDLNIAFFNGYVENTSLYYDLPANSLLKYAIINETLEENSVILTDYILYCLKNYKIIDFNNILDCIGKEINYYNYKFKVSEIKFTGFEETQKCFSSNNFYSNKFNIYRNAMMSKKTYYNFFSALYEQQSSSYTTAFFENNLIYFSKNASLQGNEMKISLSLLNLFLNKNLTLSEAEEYKNKNISIGLTGGEGKNKRMYDVLILDVLEGNSNNEISLKKLIEIKLYSNGRIDYTPDNYYIYQWNNDGELFKTIRYFHDQDLKIAHQTSTDSYLVYNNLIVALQIFSFINIVLIGFISYLIMYMIFNFLKINHRNFSILQLHGVNKLSCNLFIIYDNIKILIISAVFGILINLLFIEGINGFVKNNLLVNVKAIYFSVPYFLGSFAILFGLFTILSFVPLAKFRKKEMTSFNPNL